MNLLDRMKKSYGKPIRIEKQQNPYRMLLKEEDGLTAFYFSCPIYRRRDGMLLNGEWTSENDTYATEGVDSCCRIRERSVQLFRNRQSITLYFPDEELQLEPTCNGIMVRAPGNRLTFQVRPSQQVPIRQSSDCLAWLKGELLPEFLVSGIGGENGCALQVSVNRFPNGCDEVTMECLEETNWICFSVHFHVEKMMFDTTVDAGRPAENNAFGAVARLDGESQQLYLRFALEPMTDLSSLRVQRAELLLPRFSRGGGCLQAYRVEKPWCSFGTTWTNRLTPGKLLAQSVAFDDSEQVDVTEVIRTMFRRREPRDPGLMLKGNRETFALIATADNDWRPPMLKLRLLRP